MCKKREKKKKHRHWARHSFLVIVKLVRTSGGVLWCTGEAPATYWP